MKAVEAIGPRAEQSVERLTSVRIGGETQEISGAEAAPAGPSFATVLAGTVEAADTKQKDAVARAEALAAGKTDDLHGTMIAMKEADISLKLVGSVRTKLLDAFHELWRTSV